MKKFSSRALVCLFGILFAIASLEVALRVFALVMTSATSLPSRPRADQALRILCVGNSYTFGAGAPKGESYPDQLQRLLAKSLGDHVAVTNLGLMNVNSSFVSEQLPGWLQETKPKIVFAMVGEPNVWNRYGYWNFLQRTKASVGAGVLERLDALRWLRTFRLVELLWNRPHRRNQTDAQAYSSTFKRARKDTEEGKFILGYLWIGVLELGHLDMTLLSTVQRREVEESLKVLVAREPKNIVAWRLLAENAFYLKRPASEMAHAIDRALAADEAFNFRVWRFLRFVQRSQPGLMSQRLKASYATVLARIPARELPQLEQYFKVGFLRPEALSLERRLEMLRYYPTHHMTLTFITRSKFGPHQESVFKAVARILELNPLSPNTHFLGPLRKDQGKLSALKERLEASLQNHPHGLGSSHLMDMISLSKLDADWLYADLEDIISNSRAAGATVVIQTYPPNRLGGTREVDLLLRAWWRARRDKRDLLFQDVGRELQGIMEKAGNREQFYTNDYGPQDNHLSAKGYGEVARLMETFLRTHALLGPRS